MRLLWIAWILIKRALSKKGGVLLFLAVPVIAISLLIGLFDGTFFKVEAVNLDKGFLGKHLVSEMSHKYSVKVIQGTSEAEAIDHVFRQGTEAAFVIPEEFSQIVLEGGTPEIRMVQLRTNEMTVSVKQQLSDETRNMAHAVSLLKERYPSQEDLEHKLEELFQLEKNRLASDRISSLRTSNNMAANGAVGLLLVFMMAFANKSVVAMMEDREHKRIMRVFSTPVRPLEIAAGNFIGGFLLVTLQVLIVLGVTRLGMGFDYGVDFVPQFLLLECFLIASIGLCAALAGVAKGSQELGLLNNFIQTPSCMIGGCFWPVEIMPDFLQKLANFVPQKWVLDAMSQMASGSRLSDVSLNIGILLLFAVILLSFGSVIFYPEERETR